jgi:hypothetical protein
MEMHKVKSSNIESIGYDEGTHRMRVKFSSGTLYEYEGVSKENYQKLRDAESVGSHFAKHIRGNHAGKKVDS